MPEQNNPRFARVVKGLRIVLLVLLIVYGAAFIGSLLFMVTVFPSFIHHVSEAGFRADLRVLLDFVLTIPVYLFIFYHIFRLIRLIARGDPFGPAAPRHIRDIAYAVFALAIVSAASTIVSAPGFLEVSSTVSRWGLISEITFRALYKGLTTVLLGFGFLVIAKVLEVGVKLQQDQNLTV